ncbi:LAMI_0F11936g1_1 [Lachancea mirantina]|uniref:LAMI_0F11936g1_1 n=1 Tax=Lachancea mirantina TaxID=1230905 RepID=A0A1G4K2N8_9SACH|nr:LAMI_0F11936g1_1 [Lachancea mirantina]
MGPKSAFNRKTATKFAVVHRPHDDPRFFDSEASEHVLVPIDSRHQDKSRVAGSHTTGSLEAASRPATKVADRDVNTHMGEASLYGITFDDSKYDYTQHLKPIGLDPAHSVFIPSKPANGSSKLQVEDLFVEPEYAVTDKKSEPMFSRGVAKQAYLAQQQDVHDEIRGFQPDLNPALREVLEALEDEAYVVNEDIEVKPKQRVPDNDDIFGELLRSGEVDDAEDFDGEFDEWDIDNLDGYEQEQYRHELEQFDQVQNLEDLQNIDYQADVTRFKKEISKTGLDSDAESNEPGFGDSGDDLSEEENDTVGELPSINGPKTTRNKKKTRRKMGAKSDVSGFSMSSSAIARSEAMTVLDDKYDNIISGYENYEEEQILDEQEVQPFDFANERADFESMLDDFLDNFELEQGGRKLTKKDSELQRIKDAADQASKSKLSMRRKKEAAKRNKNGASTDSIAKGIESLRF